ncbi:MAG: lysozyme [Delftia acidovorans]|nr:MAG: lysozyme [Delftia acidovorans]
MTRSVSPKGRKFLYAHEGVVKKAYRCPAGIWTIGAGLTTASGVIIVKPGMVITEEENDRLVDLALKRNYLPRVLKALGDSCSQHALDASTSFDYNTGKIHSASWVKSFLANDPVDTRRRLLMWNKGNGRVLPGLTRRRGEEATLLLDGRFPAEIERSVIGFQQTKPGAYAAIVVSLTTAEIEEAKKALVKLGYNAGAPTGAIDRVAVELFQKAHDLTVDGKVGMATLATLQRELDARSKAAQGSVATAGGAGVAGGDQVAGAVTGPAPVDPTAVAPDQIATLVGLGIATVAIVYLGWQAYRYRDVIAARIGDKAPRFTAFLRSF